MATNRGASRQNSHRRLTTVVLVGLILVAVVFVGLVLAVVFTLDALVARVAPSLIRAPEAGLRERNAMNSDDTGGRTGARFGVASWGGEAR